MSLLFLCIRWPKYRSFSFNISPSNEHSGLISFRMDCLDLLVVQGTASVRSILFLSFIVPIFAWNIPLVSLICLKRSLVFPILLFSCISLHWSLRKAFLSLLAILGTLHSNRYIFPFLLCLSLLFFSQLTSLLFTAICKASSDNYFAFLHFFFLEMVLITASWMSQSSIHSSSGILSDLIPWIYFSLPPYNH